MKILILRNKPFYVERESNGRVAWLKVEDWYFQAWQGCFCLISDRDEWLAKPKLVSNV